ncbi:2-keto-4-pentenoate hydratase/2-oxohepta-3-ene-1,7-dioic acid hydratase in catechol pathway [Paenarthrobacter nicotinovorans]|uniref:fumarylacetoacetate hydrolase family protein n=1 Tax=Micrococcaceae TaxID=1268 RepID=UPI0008762C01|nr:MULTISPECIES: fumarylacetoacetate hydrolase family protein [Micrococcaceae]MDR6436549.1 2-keto-4-pentenoate hydratase/2-oxohepta-3-ene-1,7-dioic acid hydratase in catechol pathway [Paenarthrobacter nicotinovorans]BCW58728.1 fumarylacetoacetate hydrolase [Arthrobacter sp. StoSoilB20]SCZ57358.1 2-keto-4-pentenoate hydratase/2-oxohepta-3-ene-1,7-dioic acid hydratase (catechol pathway) [Arthrobacter sp. UNCCL28]
MQYIGINHDGGPWVAALSGERVFPLASVTDFWADAARWQEKAPALITDIAAGLDRAAVIEVPLVPASARVICVGLNYKAHAAEGSYKDQELPPYPTLFGRWTASLSVGNVPVPVPGSEAGLDWEGEVAAYIGRRVESGDEAAAEEAIFGYSTFNDITARRAQKLTSQWTLGKNGDFTGPMGPLVSRDDVGDLRDGLQVRTRVNGTEVQNGNTRDMIFSVPAIVSLISETFTLHPGDVIASGTPEGVGYARTPQWLLQAGDVVEVEIEKLGTLVTPVGEPSLRARA